MLIRSQDKMCLTNMAQVTDIFCNESRNGESRNITAMMSNADTTHLGTYSTKEKAIKVLNMICNFYTEHLEEIYNDQNPFVRSVFQMPQDSEV